MVLLWVTLLCKHHLHLKLCAMHLSILTLIGHLPYVKHTDLSDAVGASHSHSCIAVMYLICLGRCVL